MINDTLSGNSASYGGGIFNIGSLEITNSTLNGNSASYGGGLYDSISGASSTTQLWRAIPPVWGTVTSTA